MSDESWYGTDSKVWFYVSMIMSVTIVVVGLLAMLTACAAPAGTDPDHPMYVKCENP